VVPDGARRDVVSELRAIADREVRNSVPMILDVVEGTDAARTALSAAFDDPQVTECGSSTSATVGRCPGFWWPAVAGGPARPSCWSS